MQHTDDRNEAGALPAPLADIDAILDRARRGQVAKADAVADIERVLRRQATSTDIYQKPLG